MRPSHERLLAAIGAEWESSTLLADRASVNSKAAGQMLAALWRRSLVERRQCVQTGRWEYRRVIL